MEHFDYKRILVPTDMSDFATLALRYGALFREKLGSSLTLLYADELYLPADILEAPIGYYLENSPASRSELQTKLTEYASAQIGGTFETVVVQDSPSRAIVNTSRQMKPDLIIMGTHGRRGLRRAILGSVTENVLREADGPVLTVTPALMTGSEPTISHILCPVNFTHVAREALLRAAALAESFDARLLAVYVIEGIEIDRADDVESAFTQWVEPQVRDRCDFTRIVIRDGHPAERVLKLAEDAKADLLVVGAQHKFFSDATVIGTTTERITRFARCPVLTVVRKARAEVHEEEPALAGAIGN
jgi:nucleotide-binding universal stress UspA family protein